LHEQLSLSSGTGGTCLVHRRSDWSCRHCNCPAGLLAAHPVRWAHKLDAFARDPLCGRRCGGGNASPELHVQGRTSRRKCSAVHRGEWPFQRTLELDLAESADCTPGLDDRDRLTAAEARLPRRSTRGHCLVLRIRLAPSRHRGSWGPSLVGPDRRAEASRVASDRQLLPKRPDASGKAPAMPMPMT
jgi:hypothetical protein